MRFASGFRSLQMVIALGLSVVGSAAVAKQEIRPFIALGPEIGAPRGFVEMCEGGGGVLCSATDALTNDNIRTAALAPRGVATGMRDRGAVVTDVAPETYPRHASPRERNGSESKMEEAHHAMLSRVNRYVNGRVRQMTDYQIFGQQEVWQRSGVGPGARGDCEDIAIEKRYQLLSEGFPPERLFFAVVYSRGSGLHTLLVAHTDDGDVVLDNRTPFIRPWYKTDYSWISVQSTTDPMIWRSLA